MTGGWGGGALENFRMGAGCQKDQGKIKGLEFSAPHSHPLGRGEDGETELIIYPT